MPRSNPVRAQYAVIGTIVCAGIRTIGGDTFIAAEGSTASLSVQDPASVVWFTQRTLNRAMRIVQRQYRERGDVYDVNLEHPVVVQELVDALNADGAVKRFTEDHIAYLLDTKGGDPAANRAYAQEQVAKLQAYYLVSGAAKSAA